MKIEKYHGLGNTFLIVEYIQNIDYVSLSKKLCDEKLSIGSDGLIVVKQNPLEMMIFNKDGSEALMCGNGLRCFVHFCHVHKLINKKDNIEIKTKTGFYYADIISIKPFVSKIKFNRSLVRKENLTILGCNYDSYFVKAGVPHNVIIKNQLSQELIDKLKFQDIKLNTNVDIIEQVNKNNIKVLTYEKGVGFTSSCGTGAVASSLVSNYLLGGSNYISVLSEFGKMDVEIDVNNVFLTGESNRICMIEVNND